MLRLQQYERLMKTLLAHHELAGPADALESQRAANLEKVSDKTLGTLVKSLFESYAVPDGFERELLPEDKVPTDRISMAISYRMTMAPERLAEVRGQIEELVVMRNELVHGATAVRTSHGGLFSFTINHYNNTRRGDPVFACRVALGYSDLL